MDICIYRCMDVCLFAIVQFVNVNYTFVHSKV